MSPEKVVRDFCAAVVRCDIQELLGFFAADAVYHNIPMDAVRGHEAIAATLAQFMSPGGKAEFEIRHLATSGSAVLTERLDRFTMAGKSVEIPVMGTFEVDASGKITAWRDYFDLQMVMKQLG